MLFSAVFAVVLLGSCLSAPAPRSVGNDLLKALENQGKDALTNIVNTGANQLTSAATDLINKELNNLLGHLLGKRSVGNDLLKALENQGKDALTNLVSTSANALTTTATNLINKELTSLLGHLLGRREERNIGDDLLKALENQGKDALTNLVTTSASTLTTTATNLINKELTSLLGHLLGRREERNIGDDLLKALENQGKDALTNLVSTSANALTTTATNLINKEITNLLGHLLGKRDVEESRRNVLTDALKNIIKSEAANLEKTLLDKLTGGLFGKRTLETDLIKSMVLPEMTKYLTGVVQEAVGNAEHKLIDWLNKL